jgi:UDP-N-acetylglucosamine transferase subunit ALG13
VIFLTVGTHEPFDRLVRAVDEWAAARGFGHRVFGQITKNATYLPTAFEWVANLDPDEFNDRCRTAGVIVSHAGMGTIINVLSIGKPMVVLPRRGHLGETRNDHQHATVQRLQGRPGLFVAFSDEDLRQLLDCVMGDDAIGGGPPISRYADEQLISTIRSFIHGD